MRYGGFYGPGTAISQQGWMVNDIRKRRVPVIGGGGVWSFIHIDDAARFTRAAITRGAPGIYNIVDDDPAPVSEWLSALAEAVGANPPRKIPAWIARFMIGDAVVFMTDVRGASNAKAKQTFGLNLIWPSWRDRNSRKVSAIPRNRSRLLQVKFKCFHMHGNVLSGLPVSIVHMDADITTIAALIGDPTRTNMLLALMGGLAFPAGELAMRANVAPQTASSHLSKLLDAKLLSVEVKGRQRYYRLAGPEIASVIEFVDDGSPSANFAYPVRTRARQSPPIRADVLRPPGRQGGS